LNWQLKTDFILWELGIIREVGHLNCLFEFGEDLNFRSVCDQHTLLMI
jgi:hypothetical protein